MNDETNAPVWANLTVTVDDLHLIGRILHEYIAAASVIDSLLDVLPPDLGFKGAMIANADTRRAEALLGYLDRVHAQRCPQVDTDGWPEGPVPYVPTAADAKLAQQQSARARHESERRS